MIKRIKKIMALVLVATSVVAIAPREMFKGNVTAYAATTKEGMPTEQEIIGALQEELKKEYLGCLAVKVIPEPVKTLNITLTTSETTKIATPIAEKKAKQIVEAKGLHDGDPGYDDAVKATTKVILTQLVPVLQAACKNIPIYKYAAIGTDGQTVIGKGFVVGGGVEALLLQTGKSPIYVDATNLDSTIVNELIDKIKVQ